MGRIVVIYNKSCDNGVTQCSPFLLRTFYYTELLINFSSFYGKNTFCLVIYFHTGNVEKLNVDLTSLVSGTSSGTIFFTKLVCLSLTNWLSI